MPKCKNCSKPIEFKPHPVSGKPAPFDIGGDIHFATCRNKQPAAKPRKRIESLESYSCDGFIEPCGEPGRHCFMRTLSNGRKQLSISCQGFYQHIRAISHHPENFKLKNVSDEDADDLAKQIKEENDSIYAHISWGSFG